MKKVIKIIGIIVIVIIVLVGLFFGGFYLKEVLEKNKLNNERINSKTLSEYIEYHDQKHMIAKDNTINFLEFSAKDIKCDLLNNNKILHYTKDENSGILILDDYSIYTTIFGSEKLYSNNQQYKKIDLGIDVKRIQIQFDQIYLISTDNKYYSFNNLSQSIEELTPTNSIEYNLLKDENIKKIVRKYTNSKTEYNEYTIIKNDGQVYLQEYKYLNYTSFVKESILISKDKYGSISDLTYDVRINNSANSSIEYKDICITKIVSDNGVYYLKPIYTEDSKKYVDIEPTYEMSKSDIYSKYEEDIFFINCDFVFTKDKNIILTNYLCNELDKEVK